MENQHMPELKPEHLDIVKDYLKNTNSQGYSFMLTIARDGESPARSIYHFGDAITAAEAYSRYDNFGFAKEFLTVSLYEPSGKINTKVLKRPPAGECSYIKKNYIQVSNLLKSYKDSLTEELVELLDPTGISSYDDLYRSAHNIINKKDKGVDDYVDLGLNVMGALPVIGKAGKLLKLGKTAL